MKHIIDDIVKTILRKGASWDLNQSTKNIGRIKISVG